MVEQLVLALRALFYPAHASSRSAALRWGALRATASRPCLGSLPRLGAECYFSHPLCTKLLQLGPTGLEAGQRCALAERKPGRLLA